MSTPEAHQDGHTSELDERVAAVFVANRYGNLDAQERAQLEVRIAGDASFAESYARAMQSWRAVSQHASTPEIMALREQALARARKASARRWSGSRVIQRRSFRVAAAILGGVVAIGIAWQSSPYGYRAGLYETGIGERKTIDLPDRSRIALDAGTRVRVTYSTESRTVEIVTGQAQFTVAKDLARPFKVVAGNEVIMALGTVFTVEYVDQEIHIAMLEGKVAVLPADVTAGSGVSKSAGEQSISLAEGEGLEISRSGKATFTPKADLGDATAWQQNKVIFHSAELGDAVRRLNRYSHLRLVIDSPDLARLKVTGMFDAGDSRTFADAVESSLPVVADYSHTDVIHFRMK